MGPFQPRDQPYDPARAAPDGRRQVRRNAIGAASGKAGFRACMIVSNTDGWSEHEDASDGQQIPVTRLRTQNPTSTASTGPGLACGPQVDAAGAGFRQP